MLTMCKLDEFIGYQPNQVNSDQPRNNLKAKEIKRYKSVKNYAETFHLAYQAYLI